jgi:FkbM family methyltransferase
VRYGWRMHERLNLRDGLPLQEFRRLLPRRPNIIEVGAHAGSTTIGFRRLFPRARILAFEPEPRAVAKFKAQPALKDVTLLECAVGDRTGEATFHRSGGRPPGHAGEDWDASGSIRQPTGATTAHPWLTFDHAMTVPLVRLDDVVARHGFDGIDLIWADVQGAEEDLIRGAAETMRKTRYFYTECTSHEEYRGQIGLGQLCALLPDFEIVELFRHDVLLRNRTIPPLGRWPILRWWA